MNGPARDPEILAVFDSPWSRSLRWLTTLSVLILVGLVAVALALGPFGNPAWVAVLLAPALVALVAAGFFTIRRYEIAPGELLVRRLGWTTTVDLDGLESVGTDPQAMRDARRTFGRGQVSRLFNTYVNDQLGHFQAYGKQEDHAVVLQFPRRTVVVTPAEPERMASTLDDLIPGPPAGSTD